MKKLIIALALLLAFPAALWAQTSEQTSGQTIDGKVFDAVSGEPVGYVNIGVVGTTTGTVSYASGDYTLKIPEDLHAGTLRFSCIGYEDYDIAVADFITGGVFDVRLTPREFEIDKLVFSPKKHITRVLGNKKGNPMIGAGAGQQNRGYEIGVVMKTKKQVRLERCTIRIYKCLSPEVIFRLNIYKITPGGGFENVLTEPIYGHCSYTEEPSAINIDLKPYDIVLDGDFMVAFQHIDDNEGLVVMQSSLFGAKSMVRLASQGVWEDFPVKFPISVTVRMEK